MDQQHSCSLISDWTCNHTSTHARHCEWQSTPTSAVLPAATTGAARWDLLAQAGFAPEDSLDSTTTAAATSGSATAAAAGATAELTGVFTRKPVLGASGWWGRPNRQVATLRWRPCCSDSTADTTTTSNNSSSSSISVTGSLSWPEEQAVLEFTGSVRAVSVPNTSSTSSDSSSSSDAAAVIQGDAPVLEIDGTLGAVLQGCPARLSWATGAQLKGSFDSDGVAGKLTAVWSSLPLAAEPLPALSVCGMRVDVATLPDLCSIKSGSPITAVTDDVIDESANAQPASVVDADAAITSSTAATSTTDAAIASESNTTAAAAAAATPLTTSIVTVRSAHESLGSGMTSTAAGVGPQRPPALVTVEVFTGDSHAPGSTASTATDAVASSDSSSDWGYTSGCRQWEWRVHRSVASITSSSNIHDIKCCFSCMHMSLCELAIVSTACSNICRILCIHFAVLC
jgi:hypothetical protein